MERDPIGRGTFFFGIIGLLMIYWSQCVSADRQDWNLNDVSFLFSLPGGDASAAVDLLEPQDVGAGGRLLPEEIFRRIPTLLNAGNGNETLYRRSLRVTSARFDPCPDPEAPSCSPELRLVWQPVEYDEFKNSWTTRDAALHCIYALSETDFMHLRADLWQVKLKYGQLGVDTTLRSLGIHPAMQNEATADAFSRDIQSIMLRYAGTSNLRKITFSALRVPTRWWRFGGFEKDEAGSWGAVDIPRIDAHIVDIFNVAMTDGDLGPNEGLDAVFNVLPEDYPDSDNLFAVINKGYRFNDHRDLAVFREKLDAVARFRNPHSSSTDSLDCASCHYADAARYYVSNRFPELGQFRSDDEFDNPDPGIHNLQNSTVVASSTRVVRAFGYFDEKPAVSQRTIHDSAVSAHWLNTHDEPDMASTRLAVVDDP